MHEFLKRARFPAAALAIAGLALPVIASFFTTLHWTVDWVALFLKHADILTNDVRTWRSSLWTTKEFSRLSP